MDEAIGLDPEDVPKPNMDIPERPERPNRESIDEIRERMRREREEYRNEDIEAARKRAEEMMANMRERRGRDRTKDFHLMKIEKQEGKRRKRREEEEKNVKREERRREERGMPPYERDLDLIQETLIQRILIQEMIDHQDLKDQDLIQEIVRDSIHEVLIQETLIHERIGKKEDEGDKDLIHQRDLHLM